MCPCVADRIEFGSVGKTGVPKTTGRTIKGENQQQTQPSYGVDAGSRTQATLVITGGRRRLLTPLHQPCSKAEKPILK